MKVFITKPIYKKSFLLALFTVLAYSSFGCISPVTITGPTSVCTGATITLSDGTAGGTWSTANTLTATITAGPGTGGGILTGVSAGTAVITYSTGTGCSITTTITVNALPASITGLFSICVGSDTTLVDNTSGGVWSISNTSLATLIPSSSNCEIEGANPGIGTISYTVGSCSATTTITVNPVPVAITGPTAVCAGSSISLSDATTGGTWSSSNTVVATIAPGIPNLTGVPGPGGISVIYYTVGTGCATTTTITVNPIPVTITGNTTICAGLTSQLSDATLSGVWSSSNTFVATISASGVVTGLTGPGGTSTIAYTLPTGCNVTALFTVNPLPAAITGSTSICSGATTTLTDATTGGIWSSSNHTAATVGSISGFVTGAVVATSQTTVITYSLTATGCATVTTMTVNPLPAAITGNTTICAGLTTQLSDATTGGTWTSGAPTVATIGSLTGLVTGVNPGPGVTSTSAITYTLPTGCPALATVTVNPLPGVIIGPTAVCLGLTIPLSDATGGGTWSSNNTNASVGLTSGVVTGLNPGASVITYSLPTGCTQTINIIVNPLPTAIAGNTNVCTGLTTTLSDGAIGGIWSSSNTNVATIGSTSGIVYGGIVPGTTTTITYTLPTGCIATTTVTVNPFPAGISGVTTVCSGLTTQLSDITPGGTWSSSVIATATVGSGNGLVTGGNVAVQSYSGITYTLPTGCIAVTTVTVNPLPTTISGNTTICAGLTTQLSDGTTGGNWSSNNTNITIGATSGLVTGSLVSAQSTATVTYTLGTGCIMTTTITVNPSPDPITGNIPICAGLTTTLSDATPGGTWSSSVPTTATVGSTTGLVTGGIVLIQKNTIITYTLPTTCIITATETVNPLPLAIAGPNAVCAGSTIYLSDPTSGGVWSSSNATATIIPAAGIGVLTGGSNPGGLDTISYTLGTGCVATKTVTVNIQPALISGGPLSICQGATAALSDAVGGGIWSSGNNTIATVGTTTGIVTGVSVGNTAITYSIGSCTNATLAYVNTQPGTITGTTSICSGGSTILLDAPSGGIWSASNSVVAVSGGVVTANTPGIDTISYTIGSCISTTTVLVNVQPVAIVPGIVSLCNAGTATLSDPTAGGVWSSANTLVATVGSATGFVTGLSVGTAVISYTEITGGCSAERTVTINFQPGPISGIMAICNGLTTQLSDVAGGGVWSVSTSSIAVATVTNTGFVTGLSAGTAIITHTIGTCFATATVTVNPLPAPISGIFYVCDHSTTNLADLSPFGAWSSSNSTIAAIVSNTGVVIGNNIGTALITYTLPTGCSDTQRVTVILQPAAISGNTNVCAGNTISLSDAPAGGAWTSSNTNVATIDAASGVVTGVSSGTLIISYSLGTGCNSVIPIAVNPLSPIMGDTGVCVGQTINLSDTTTGGTWSSSNTALATVNQVTGVVTGVTAGIVFINYDLPTGCTATATITINPLPAPITGSTVICDGTSTTLSDATSGGVWTSANTNVATVDPVLGTVTGSGNTGTSTSTVVIIDSAIGCFTTTTVTVEPLPQAIMGSTSVCIGVASALTDATPGGTWSSSNTNAIIGSSTGIVTGVVAGTATITYSLSSGCSITILITINALPAQITGPSAVCVGSTIALSDVTPGGAWFSSNPSVAVIGFASGIITGESPGTAVITDYGIVGCIITTTITVNPTPLPITGPSSLCLGATATLSSGPSGGVWSSTNTPVATIDPSTGFITSVFVGTTVISYTFASTTGCSTMITETVNPLPAPVTGINAVCAGGLTTNLYDATPGGVWVSSNTLIATVDPVTGVVYDVASTGTVTITDVFPTGCNASIIVTVNPQPVAITGPSTVCAGSQITLSDGITGGTWTSSNTAVATIDPASGIVTGINSGFTIVIYTMGGGSCFRSYAVTVNPLPAPVTGITSVCEGLTTTLSDATGGGGWSSITTGVATIDPSSGIVTGVTAGSSEISYTLSSTGCASTTTVTVNALPVPISGNTNVCLGDTRTLSDSSTPGTWSSSNTNITTVTTLSPSSSGVVYGTGPGTDIVTYTISATGCIMTATVTVHPLPAVYTVTGGGSYCSDTSGVPVGLSGSQIGVDYLLYLGSTPVGTFAGTGSALSFGLQTLSGTYTVVALNTFTTCSNSMTGSAVVTVILSPVPAVSISTGGAGDTVCAGTVVNYTATGVNGGSTPVYQWSVNGIAVDTGDAYSYVPANNNEVVVTMTSSLHCANPMTVSDTVIMTVLTPVRPSVGLVVSPADTVCLGSAVTLTAVPSYGGATPVYLWTVDGTGITSTTGPVYMYVPSNGDIVSCRMVSDYRCVLGADTVSGPAELITVDTPQVLGVTIVSSPGWGISQGASDTLYAVVTNGGLTPTYQWYVNGVPVPGATTPEFVSNSFSYPNEDSVSCVVTGSGYCPESGHGWMYITVNAAGVTQVSSAMAELSVIPNPNNGTFTLKGTLGTTADEVVSLELTDVLGQVVYKQEVQTKGGSINDKITLSNTLANGMYMLNVQSASVTKVFHIVIEQ